MRRTLLTLLAVALAVHTAVAQRVEALQFDVVSVKRNTSGEQGGRNALDPGAYVGINVTLRRLLALAYQPVPNAQIVGGPSWMNVDRFDVQATFTGTLSRPQLQQMMRTMIGDRFKVRSHMESRPTRVFALIALNPDALGPSLKRSDIDCTNPAERTKPNPAGAPACGFQYTDGLIQGHGVTLDQVAAEIAAGRTVVNRSNLPGTYDVELRWTPESTQAPSDDAPPTLATALREQLGLRLESATLPMDFLVIDSAELPEEN